MSIFEIKRKKESIFPLKIIMYIHIKNYKFIFKIIK